MVNFFNLINSLILFINISMPTSSYSMEKEWMEQHLRCVANPFELEKTQQLEFKLDVKRPPNLILEKSEVIMKRAGEAYLYIKPDSHSITWTLTARGESYNTCPSEFYLIIRYRYKPFILHDYD